MRAAHGFCLVLLACAGKDPYNPGTALGTFHAKAALTDASCGGNPPNPWEFDLKLSQDKSNLYWVQGGLPVQGTLDAAGHFTLSQASTSQVSAADKTHGACLITRTDTLAGDLADGGVANGFSGTLTYGFAPTDGADCVAQIGGTFNALPCAIRYDLTAVRTIAPDAGK